MSTRTTSNHLVGLSITYPRPMLWLTNQSLDDTVTIRPTRTLMLAHGYALMWAGVGMLLVHSDTRPINIA